MNHSSQQEFWNQRYAESDYAYGDAPNAFVQGQIWRLSEAGRVLLPGDGQGRNSVWLAQQGFDVTCVDWSETGRARALELAARHSVSIEPVLADLTAWLWPESTFDAVVAVHLHLMPDARQQVHRAMLQALKPGGQILLEAFDQEQAGLNSGGPRNLAMLYSAEMLAEDFAEAEILMLERAQVVLDEGLYHQGVAEVVRMVAQQPAI
ncbi:MAG TPA: class I SAM-dependent methyltransferase [bacterium]|nr:class I SAM-dependent methyltransferase [bacterium]